MSFSITTNRLIKHLDELKNIAKKSDTLVIVSPFLSDDLSALLNDMNTIHNIEIYTNIDGYDMAVEVIESLFKLYKYCEENSIALNMFYDDSLHGKVYLFYKKTKPKGFITTSANFTNKGLTQNIEYGIHIKDNKLQNEMLKNIKCEVSHVLSAVYLEYLYGKAVEFRKKHPKQNGAKFTSAKFIRSKIIKEPRYYLKSIGRKEKPHPEVPYVKDIKLGFSTQSFHKGDILVISAIKHVKIVGLYMVMDDVPERYLEDISDKWPYKYKLRCMSPSFSKKWWIYNVKTMELEKDYKLSRLKEDDHITESGDTLKAIHYGRPFKVTKPFVDFILKRMNEAKEKKTN